ncbi:MAG: radical SAM protein [Christensenellaceae bacterium]|jgi:radical SAM superfamily enzyme YgiQ (UPF0313 family)
MQYIGDIYRPPSEANSLIIQVTVGCARNSCTFCSMYKAKKFYVREMDDILSDLEEMSVKYGKFVDRIFLADGNALIIPAKDMVFLLTEIKRLFPQCRRISSYGAPKDVLEKTPEELKAIYEAGLELVYMGLESGDETVLKQVKKGVTAEEIVQAGIKLRQSGMKLSLTIISGLGSKERLQQHAEQSALAMNRINPEYASLLTLMVEPGTPLYKQVQSGEFELLSATDVMDELLVFLENCNSEGTVFRSNHASNYLALAGTFNGDIDRLIEEVLQAKQSLRFRPEGYRRL